MSDTKTPKSAKSAKAKAKMSDARAKASDAAQRAADAIEQNPLSLLAGGIAVGIIAGALIPRTDREKAVLAGVGKRIADTTSAAVKAARDTGKQQLSGSVLSKDAAKSGIQAVLGSALVAAKEASKKPTAPTKARKPKTA